MSSRSSQLRLVNDNQRLRPLHYAERAMEHARPSNRRDESVPESFVPAGVYFGYLPKSQEQEIDDISGGESNPLPFKYFPWDAEMHRSINAELQ